MKQCYTLTGLDVLGKIRSYIRLLTVILLYVTFALPASAQGGGKAVSGIVKDDTGNPLIGVTVTVPGTTKGTTTDANGTYTINADNSESLNFSYVGYKPQTIHVNNQSTIDVTMSEDNTSLEEVVVVGYGVQKRRDIVGAVETLSTKGLEERMGSSMSISRSLQGAIPGLTMTFSDGKPNRGATVRIRGAENSIGSGGSALVMVDGVETDMSTVNPDDIESITVLKDASSPAVYGARGTFGVILLTTKKPQKGSAKVTYNGTFTFYKRATKPEMVTNGYDYTTSFLESYVNAFGKDPSNINNVFKFSRTWYNELARRNSDPSYEKWRVNNRNVYEYFGNTNWYDVFYKDYTTGHQHNISVTGGGDVASYYVSGRMFEQDGIYNAGDEKYQQFNVKAKGIVNVKPWLRVENTTDFMYRYSHQPTSHTGISTTPMTVSRMLNHQAYPVALVTNPDGTWTEAAVYTGWAGFVEGNSWRKDRKFDMNNRTAVTIDLLKDVLVAAADVSFYFNQTDRRQAVNSYTYYTGPDSSGERPSGSLYEERSYNRQKVASSATLTYTPRLGDNHSLSIMGGWNIEDYTYKSNLMSREGIIIPGKPNFSLLEGEAMTLKDNGSYDWGLVGAFYRVSYSYKGKYLLEASGRYDGNSKFPSNQRWGFFPSGSVGWRISEEPFFEGIRKNFNNLKIRCSYGQLGNQNVGYYDYIRKISIGNQSYLFGGDKPTTATISAPVASNLSWETSIHNNLGVDMSFLNNRLAFSADFYIRDTKDMLTAGVALPGVYGADPPKMNSADLRTKGYELSLSWRDEFQLLRRPFTYSVTVTFNDYVTDITKYDNPDRTFAKSYYEGMRWGEIWGYRTGGLFASDAEAAGYAVDQTAVNNRINAAAGSERGLHAGDLKFLDLDGDNIISIGKNTVDDPGDREIIGNSQPRFHYGTTLSMSWAGIDFSIFFQGVGRRQWYPKANTIAFWGPYARPYASWIPKDFHKMYWSEENPDAYFPRPRGYVAISGTNRELTAVNDRYLQDIRYCRLKNLTIGYTLPKKWTRKVLIDNLRIYFTGENLATWSPIRSDYIDPEMAAMNDEMRTYPWQKTYMFGVDVTF